MIMDEQVSFRDELFNQGVLLDSGVGGLHARNDEFEDMISRFERFHG